MWRCATATPPPSLRIQSCSERRATLHPEAGVLSRTPHLTPPGQWFQCQANGSNVCRVLRTSLLPPIACLQASTYFGFLAFYDQNLTPNPLACRLVRAEPYVAMRLVMLLPNIWGHYPGTTVTRSLLRDNLPTLNLHKPPNQAGAGRGARGDALLPLIRPLLPQLQHSQRGLGSGSIRNPEIREYLGVRPEIARRCD